MSIEIKYVCDRCSHAQDTDDQMWHVGISCDYQQHTKTIYHKKLWCRRCCVTVGILGIYVEEPKKILPLIQPTLEDMVREIIREEIGAGL